MADVSTHTKVDSDEEFEAITDPLRGELVAHCYRMLGSVQDAEDQVQETYLRAWRAYHSFEGRSSVRTWMYTIATRTCLTALEQRARRPLPTGLGAPSADPVAELESRPEVPWLQPLPDRLVVDPRMDPAGVALTRDSVRLAFIAALQNLTAGQRAALILRDVLAFSAAETADTLGVSVASANSSLQRARARMEQLTADDAEVAATDALDARQQDLLERYVKAFEAYDTRAIVGLLSEDATWEMPPYTGWYQGAAAIGTLIGTWCPAKGADDMRLVVTSANGQPACAVYMRDGDVHRAFQIHVLNISPGPAGPAVSHVTCFFETALFPAFGLPMVWEEPA